MAAQNFVQLFHQRIQQSGPRTALQEKRDGVWTPITWDEWSQASENLAAWLLTESIQPGDRVGILSNSRPEWVMSDIGILMSGAATVTIYQSNTADQIKYIVNDSGLTVLIAEDPSQLEKLNQIRKVCPGLKKVVLIKDTAHLEKARSDGKTQLTLSDLSVDPAWVTAWSEVMTAGLKALATQKAPLEKLRAELPPDQLATVVYTSGTTGDPKGVMLDHRAFVFECNSVNTIIGIHDDDIQVLFLPLAHIFAKILYLTAVENGSQIAFAESVAKVVDNIGEIRPTYMGSVPRIYEKVYSKVQAGVQQAGGLKEKIFHWSVGVGNQMSACLQKNEAPGVFLNLKYKVATKLVFGKLQQRFGGRLKFFVSGGAPLSREIAEFFHAAGILILEGYGLTETTAASHVNRLEKYRFGTVGPAIPGTECKIAEDGEILLRGPNIMRGYWQNAAATAEVLEKDGWFHSGDIGVIGDDDILKITDRKKDLIVTAGGKNIAPQNMENSLKTYPLVSQVMVHGDKRSFLTALFTLDEAQL